MASIDDKPMPYSNRRTRPTYVQNKFEVPAAVAREQQVIDAFEVACKFSDDPADQVELVMLAMKVNPNDPVCELESRLRAFRLRRERFEPVASLRQTTEEP